MIRIRRSLTFKDYVASNKIALMNANFSRKASFILSIRVLPFVGLLGFLLSVQTLIRLWTRPGNNAGAFGIGCGLAGLGVLLCVQPFIFQRKLRKMYQRQDLDQSWILEVSPQGVRSTIPGKADTHFEWAFFNRYIETKDLFILLQLKRLIFVTIPKTSLGPGEESELRELLSTYL